MNDRVRFGRQRHFVKFNISYLTAKSNLGMQQGRSEKNAFETFAPRNPTFKIPTIAKKQK